MKLRYVLVMLLLAAGNAQAEEMTVSVWDPGCNHTTATSWFTFAPGEETRKIFVDLSACTKDQLGSLLFFGNYSAKTSGRQLSSKHKVRLHLTTLDHYGNVAAEESSDSGSVLVDVAHFDSKGAWLVARNMNRNKSVRIRLRAQLVPPM